MSRKNADKKLKDTIVGEIMNDNSPIFVLRELNYRHVSCGYDTYDQNTFKKISTTDTSHSYYECFVFDKELKREFEGRGQTPKKAIEATVDEANLGWGKNLFAILLSGRKEQGPSCKQKTDKEKYQDYKGDFSYNDGKDIDYNKSAPEYEEEPEDRAYKKKNNQ